MCFVSNLQLLVVPNSSWVAYYLILSFHGDGMLIAQESFIAYYLFLLWENFEKFYEVLFEL
jgi:hypothetical protein